MTRARASVQATVTSTTSSTPTSILAVATTEAPESYTAKRALVLTGITVCNPQAQGSGNNVQVWVGILRSGESSWDATLIAPYLTPGDSASWTGSILLGEGDAVQSYSDSADRGHITIETQDPA